jgi:hypothetical protein
MRYPIHALAFLALFAGGCAHYEYDIVSPPEMAQHVGTKQPVVLSRPPLQYRLISYDDHLIVRIYNPTPDRIQLLGDESSVVDPQGQSHPLRSRMIAPNSFIKLILPPLAPEVAPYGPAIGFGLGFAYATPYWGMGFYDPLYDPLWERPRYYAVYDANGTEYWIWSGQSDVRLTLVFRRDQQNQQKPFSQDFVLHRRRM